MSQLHYTRQTPWFLQDKLAALAEQDQLCLFPLFAVTAVYQPLDLFGYLLPVLGLSDLLQVCCCLNKPALHFLTDLDMDEQGDPTGERTVF